MSFTSCRLACAHCGLYILLSFPADAVLPSLRAVCQPCAGRRIFAAPAFEEPADA